MTAEVRNVGLEITELGAIVSKIPGLGFWSLGCRVQKDTHFWNVTCVLEGRNVEASKVSHGTRKD